MKTRLLVGVACVLWLSMGSACDRRGLAEGPAAQIAVSNSYLEAAVCALLGDQVAIERLAEPGMCPGHFDVRASQVAALRDCKLLLRFDFQRGLDDKLGRARDRGMEIVAVGASRGLCVPETYAEVCGQVARALVDAGLLATDAASQRLAAIEARVDELGADVRNTLADSGLAGDTVVSSTHQADFCRAAGLSVVATFGGPDTSSVDEINTAVVKGGGARLVIANRPEGRRLADALGERLGAAVVVLDNFPDPDAGQHAFDAMVRTNVQRMLKAAAQ